MPNLQLIRKSRPKPTPGDVFRMHLLSGPWLFGRIVLIGDDVCELMPGAILVYIYAGLRDVPDPEPGWLDHRRLLIPPQWTNLLGWRRGYYETIGNWPLGPSDTYARHVFQVQSLRDPQETLYVDECRRPTSAASDQPMGWYGVQSYKGMDDDISKALGLPLAPMDEADRAEAVRRGRPHG